MAPLGSGDVLVIASALLTVTEKCFDAVRLAVSVTVARTSYTPAAVGVPARVAVDGSSVNPAAEIRSAPSSTTCREGFRPWPRRLTHRVCRSLPQRAPQSIWRAAW